MSDLPEGWEWTTLGEIAEVRLGRQRSPKNHSGTHMRPYVRAANIGWDGLKLDDVKQMNFTDSEADVYALRRGDILLSEASGSAAEVGKPAIWNEEIEGCCFQNTLIRVRVTTVDSRFLLWFLKAESLRGAFVDHSRGVGIHHIGASRLSSWCVPLPPLAEQRRIVAALEDHLSRLDVGCSALDGVSAKEGSLRRSVVDELLQPHSERMFRFEDVLASKLINGRSVQTLRGGFPVLRLTALKEAAADLGEFKEGDWGPADAEKYLVAGGDFLISRGNGSLDLVARGSLVVDDPMSPMAFPDTIVRARPNLNVLDPQYLAIAWSSKLVRQQIRAMARTTAGIYKVNQKGLAGINLPIPEINVQREIVAATHQRIESLNSLRSVGSRARVRAEHLRRSLLREAFAGRLVEQDSGDEPASVLLERIRAERESAPKVKRGRKPLAAKAAPAVTAAPDDKAASDDEVPGIDPARTAPPPMGKGTQDALDLGL